MDGAPLYSNAKWQVHFQFTVLFVWMFYDFFFGFFLKKIMDFFVMRFLFFCCCLVFLLSLLLKVFESDEEC